MRYHENLYLIIKDLPFMKHVVLTLYQCLNLTINPWNGPFLFGRQWNWGSGEVSKIQTNTDRTECDPYYYFGFQSPASQLLLYITRGVLNIWQLSGDLIPSFPKVIFCVPRLARPSTCLRWENSSNNNSPTLARDLEGTLPSGSPLPVQPSLTQQETHPSSEQDNTS